MFLCCGAQAAKEHITRPLDPAEVQLIDRAMQALDGDYRLQRRLEDLHHLPTSRTASRTVITNRWRLLPLLPHLGLQVWPRLLHSFGNYNPPVVGLSLHACACLCWACVSVHPRYR